MDEMIHRAMKQIAKEHNTTIEKVKNEIKIVIEEAMKNPDRDVQAEWEKIPREGAIPTPEDVLTYLYFLS